MALMDKEEGGDEIRENEGVVVGHLLIHMVVVGMMTEAVVVVGE